MKLTKLYTLLLMLNILYGCHIANGQLSRDDTVLYLFFDAAQFKKNSNIIGIDPISSKDNPESSYVFLTGYNLYYGYPLEFISMHKENAHKIANIKKYNVVTPEELKSFISKNYPKDDFLEGYEGQSYFDNLKEIYIVEKADDKKSYYFTKVRLDITME